MVLESVSHVNGWHKEVHCWLTWELSCVPFNPYLQLPSPLDKTRSTVGLKPYKPRKEQRSARSVQANVYGALLSEVPAALFWCGYPNEGRFGQ